ncbi:hypothetical protein EDD15DRAFT_2187261 [Pisolithus albus]|nr:hypothetical protein EDD15DRAFT_2187261 [Pisolithus albus]
MLARGEEFPGQTLHTGKRRKRNLDVGLDLLINAEEQSDGGCRRTVFNVCFDNAAAESDHHECNSIDTHGCSRCGVMDPSTCCDIHNPSDFTSYESRVPKVPRATQRSRLPKYTKDKYDYALENSLLDWCEQKTATVYGWAGLNNDGPVIMSDSTLDRIIDCAHHRKIETCQDLKREMGWMDSDLYGDEVLALIRRHAPPLPSVFVSTPLSRGTTSSITTPTVVPLPQLQLPTTLRPNKCSACGQEGHNARNRVCLNHPSHVSAGNKENVRRQMR